MNYLRLGKDRKAIDKTVKVLTKGGLVVFPFDSCYGLAVDAGNQKAVDKLCQFKGRMVYKAISVAVNNLSMAKKYAKLTKENILICNKLLPGPFTIVVEGRHKLAKGIEGVDGSLGIRIPDFKPVADLTKKFGKAITATSANVSGQNINHSIDSLKKQLSAKKIKMVDLWIDGGKLPIRQTSTVMDIRDKNIKTLRRGEIGVDKSGKGLVSESEKETEMIAEMIFNKTIRLKENRPMVFLLTGELGSGKTVFARKIGNLLGVRGKIVSPTFNIVNNYKINSKSEIINSKQIINSNYQIFKQFLHIDLYRISEEYELGEIKFLEMFTKNTMACIEWPELMGKKYFEKLRKRVMSIEVGFEYGDILNQRIIWFNLGKKKI